MRQVVQSVRSGETTVRELPEPIAFPGGVVVANVASVVSAGTERSLVELTRKTLIGKARERPEDVRRVLRKLKEEGVLSTFRQVNAKLDEPFPLGYSSAGIVLECGRGVQDLKPGDWVATVAPHAGIVSIGKNLCARIPDSVNFEQAAYTSLAAIALQGVRLARVSLGERVLVIGLGLVGQICVALLKAQGCQVFGVDLDPKRLELASQFGVDATDTGAPLEAVQAFTEGQGVDAVVIAASTTSNQPIEFAAAACRPKGRIVLVGVAGLELPRPPFFAKELEFTVSFSLGPGRGDAAYEERGHDYPIGHARWTAQRNMQAALELMAAGKLPVERLTTHRFPIERAAEAYQLITSSCDPSLGILLQYPPAAPARKRRTELRSTSPAGEELGISFIGAGNFARVALLPLISAEAGIALRGVCTAKGLNADHSARKHDFAFATTDTDEIWADRDTGAVFIATRHDLHAELVVSALRAGKHVFVEKPLCISFDQLVRIEACVTELGRDCPMIMVGFNRRFSPTLTRLRAFFSATTPLSVAYRFASGPLPADHWTQNEEIGGGRIIGEACHAIDTCVALAGGLPSRVYAESVDKAGSLQTTDDRVFITLRHANGSVSSISYQAAGDIGFPKERIEVLGTGRSAVSDNWDSLTLWSGGRKTNARGGKDKGHRSELREFLKACKGASSWPIPWDELYGVAEASLLAVKSLREGLPQNCGEATALREA